MFATVSAGLDPAVQLVGVGTLCGLQHEGGGDQVGWLGGAAPEPETDARACVSDQEIVTVASCHLQFLYDRIDAATGPGKSVGCAIDARDDQVVGVGSSLLADSHGPKYRTSVR